jgi:DNA mismatch endonuclease (patch repair protein)
MDTLTPAERSERMGRVRSKDTRPELTVRSLVHRMGYRYRLHDRSLPGNPDMVFSSRGKIIFVHGCFWHRHGKNCEYTRWPNQAGFLECAARRKTILDTPRFMTLRPLQGAGLDD